MTSAEGSLASRILALRQMLNQDPAHDEARRALCELYADQGRFEEALALLCREPALGTEPLLTWGRQRWEADQRDEALEAFRATRLAWPEVPETWYSEAFALMHLLRLEEGEAAFRAGLERFPDHPWFPFQLGWIRALRGDLREGLALMEVRSAFLPPKAPLEAPLWLGGDPRGRQLLLRLDQGFGDAIMACRFAPRLARAGAQVLLEASEPLRAILGTLAGPIRLVTQGDILYGSVEQVGLLSLPHLLEVDLEDLWEGPYLSVPGEVPHGAELEAAFAALPPGLRVGLAWAGNPAFQLTRERDLDLAVLGPWAGLEGVQWVSLQKETPHRPHLPLLDLEPLLGDFADTAYALSKLDLLITVDSALAHLAGALGLPAWVLLPALPDWRWLLDRSDSPWYPSLRLWRQTQPRQWGPVVEAVGEELRGHVARRTRPDCLS